MTEPTEDALTDLAVSPVTELKINRELFEEARLGMSSTSPDAVLNEGLRLLVEAQRAKRRAAGEALDRLVESGELVFRPVDSIDE